MYYVIYKDKLKQGKTMENFKNWLREYMPIQNDWGAKDFDVYKPLYGSSDIFYVKYTVESLDKWNNGLASPMGKRLIEAISEVIDVSKVEVSIMEKVDIEMI
jgi:hypothetical protein